MQYEGTVSGARIVFKRQLYRKKDDSMPRSSERRA
ncbi:unnamed protein product, partial [Rotaria socialis]